MLTPAWRDAAAVRYRYRDQDGEEFVIVSPTLTVARQRRDEWLAHKYAPVVAARRSIA